MDAIFIELSSFQKYRAEYLNDDQFRLFQNMLLADPEKGDVIPDTGVLRKVRYMDERRNKGARAQGEGLGLSITGRMKKAGSSFLPSMIKIS